MGILYRVLEGIFSLNDFKTALLRVKVKTTKYDLPGSIMLSGHQIY
jgi:hypothetical protein